MHSGKLTARFGRETIPGKERRGKLVKVVFPIGLLLMLAGVVVVGFVLWQVDYLLGLGYVGIFLVVAGYYVADAAEGKKP